MGKKITAASLGSPPPDADLGPLPRRSAAGLRWQFCVQPLFFVGFLGVVAVELALGLGGGAPAGPIEFPRHWFLGGQRYRLERRGSVEEWAVWASRVVTKATSAAEARERRGQSRKRWVANAPRVDLAVSNYRGVGAAAAAAMASEHGWAVDWKASPKPHRSLTLVCVKELSRPVPDPHAPASAGHLD